MTNGVVSMASFYPLRSDPTARNMYTARVGTRAVSMSRLDMPPPRTRSLDFFCTATHRLVGVLKVE